MSENIYNGSVNEQESRDSNITYNVIDELGVISESTKVLGNIETKGHLAIAGVVEGNIQAKGNVIITGIVKGSITCDNLILKNCQLATQINATGHISVEESVRVTGRISCKTIAVRGIINGDIIATDKVALSKDAILTGNVKAASIGVEFGAKVIGSMEIA